MTLSCPALTDDEKAHHGAHHARARRQTIIKKKKREEPIKCINMKATLRPETKESLYQDTIGKPAFEGMSKPEIMAWIEGRIEETLVSYPCGRPYPWWYGRLDIDRPRKPASVSQRLALEAARRRKVEIKLEAQQPYCPLTSKEHPDHASK